MVIIITTALGVTMLIALLLLAKPVVSLFTNDPGIISATTTAAHITLLGIPVYGFFNVGQLAFPSIGKVLPTLLISVLRPLIGMAALTLILPQFFQLNGVWMVFPGSDVVGTSLVLAFFIPMVRMFRKQIKEQERTGGDIRISGPQLDTGAPTV
jgi:Na+-driven multidrug efflux pump